jgi:hypothetical protein
MMDSRLVDGGQEKGLAMLYALFDGDQKLSQDYPTEQEAWQHADEAGLIETVGEERFLEDGYTIQACVADEETGDPIAVPPPVT